MVPKATERVGYWFEDICVPERELTPQAPLPDPSNHTLD